jgi:endonuclease YncB( thermonuclease family)
VTRFDPHDLWWFPATVDPGAYRDGDTLNGVTVDVGFYTARGPINVRLAGINAPERGTDAGRAATEFLDTRVAEQGYRIILRATSGAPDQTFGRYVARVFFPDGTDVCQLMINTGHADPYPARRNQP